MRRWLVVLLIAVVLLLVGSMACDAFLVHHHLNGIAVEEHFQSFFAAAFLIGLLTLRYWHKAVGNSFSYNSPYSAHAAIRFFCGWHNSSYLEVSS